MYDKKGELFSLLVLGVVLIVSGFLAWQLGNGFTGAAILGFDDNITAISNDSILINDSLFSNNSIINNTNSSMIENDTLSSQNESNESSEDSSPNDAETNIDENEPIVEDEATLEVNEDLSPSANCAVWPCSCGDTLTASVAMTSNLTGCTGIGLTIGASNIVLDCQGHSIGGDAGFGSSDVGIYSTSLDNISVRGCSIAYFYKGLYPRSITNLLLFNNTIKNNLLEGVWLNGNNGTIINNIFSNNSLAGIKIDVANGNITNNSISNSTYGILAYTFADNNIFIGNSIVNGTYGVYLNRTNGAQTYGPSNNSFVGGNITGFTMAEIYSDEPSRDYNNTFLNVSFDRDNISASNLGNVVVKWYVSTNVKDANGNPFENINIYAYDLNGNQEQTSFTGSDGVTRLELTEFRQNGTGKTYLTNNTINFTLLTFSNSTSINLTLTNSTNLSLSLNTIALNCSVINSDAILTVNLASNDSCITVNASHIKIDGNGKTLSGNGSGLGINISNFDNITLYNLTIINFSTALSIINSSYNNITNSTFENNTQVGISLNQVNFSTLSQNYILNNSFNGTVLESSYGNSIYNNFFNNTNNAFDNGTNKWNITQDCSSKNNIIGGPCLGGNYFSDYLGNDTNNSNGIGDIKYNISGENNADWLPLVMSSFINSCQTITSSTTLLSNTRLSATSTCFTINGSNLVLDGNNATIMGDGGSTDYGTDVQATLVDKVSYTNITIKNFHFKNFGRGINFECTRTSWVCSNIEIANNTIENTVTGFHLVIKDSNVTGNNITNSSGDSIYLPFSYDNNFYNNILNTSIGNGIKSYYSSTNNYYNLLINTTDSYYDFISELRSISNFFNSTLNTNNITSDADAPVYIKWYVDVNVSNSTGSPIANATVTGLRSDNVIDDSVLTSSSGIARLKLTQLYSDNNIRFIATPHTINVEGGGYLLNQTSITLSQSTTLNITLNKFSCSDLIETDIILGNNLTGNGGCFTLADGNLTIDGNGFVLVGNGSGDGIFFNGSSGVTVKNLTLMNFTTAINLENSNNSIFELITVTNNTRGIVFNNSKNNTISNSYFSNNTNASVYAVNAGNTNNSLVNVSINVTNISVEGTASVFVRWYVDVNVTFSDQNNPSVYLPLPGATTTGIFNSSSILDATGTTDSTGIKRLELAEIEVNSSGINYLTPHNVTMLFSSSSGNAENFSYVNLSLLNNTIVNFHVNLNCSAPVDTLSITQNTVLCPGTYTIDDSDSTKGIINFGANNINLTCDQTIINGTEGIKTSSFGIYNDGNTGVGIHNCIIGEYGTGIYFIDANNFIIDGVSTTSKIDVLSTTGGKINNFSVSYSTTVYGTPPGLNLVGSSSNSISNGTFNTGWEGIVLKSSGSDSSDNNNIQNITFSDQIFGVYLSGGHDNTFVNNTFSENYRAVYITSCSYCVNNSFYHNVFSNSGFRNVDDFHTTSVNFFNTTFNNSAQGNEWDDYCNKGQDNNSDDHADLASSGANDWPYNTTVSSKIFGPVTDYGPKITTCVTEVQLGDGSGSGSSTAASGSGAASATAESAPSVSISAPSASGGAYNAEEVKNFLESNIDNIQSIDDGYLVRLHLANNGEKDMILSTGLEDEAEHSYLVTRKTTGLPAWSGIRYSENSPDANLLRSQMENGDEIVLPPGETKELDLKIKSGLVAKPREIKVQVKSFGEVIKENGMTLEKVSQTGAALDHLKERHALDMYLVVSTETTASSSSDASLDSSNLNSDSSSDLLTGGSIANPLVDLMASNNHDTYLLEFNLVKKKEASGFLNLMSRLGKSAVITDVYGPYKIEKEDGFVFAQQIYYDPLVHNGEHEINTKLIKNGDVVTENSFDIVLEGDDSEKNNLAIMVVILIVLLVSVLLMFGIIIYLIINRKGKL